VSRGRLRKRLGIGAIAAVLLLAAGFAAIRPSNTRDWVVEQQVQPIVHFHGDTAVTVRHVRNFDWTNADSVVRPAYYDRTYDLRRVRSASYIVTPFSDGWRGPAHTFVSFGFDDSTYVGISVEARKEKGETYSIAKGLLKRFEVIYVVADEHDLVPLRANRWGDRVIVYPVRTSPANARAMLAGMLTRAHELESEPEFYGSIRNNCTTNILDEVNRIRRKPVRYSWKVLLPGYSDQLAQQLGLLDTTLPIDSARKVFEVDARSVASLESRAYSRRIREVGGR
jgi:hypothetical protein